MSAALLALVGCHALVDFEYDIETGASTGGAASVGSTTDATASATRAATTSPASSDATDASSASTGPLGECVTPEFQQGFESGTVDPLAEQAAKGSATMSPTRRGNVAWDIDLAATDAYARLFWRPSDEEAEHWIGFSWTHLGEAIRNGLLFELTCYYYGPDGPDVDLEMDYHEAPAFSIGLAANAPNYPFRAGGRAAASPQNVLDELDTVPQTNGTFVDWVVHFQVSRTEEGFVEAWTKDDAGNWARVFRGEGVFIDPMCEGAPILRWELIRWDDPRPADHVVFDEIAVIQVKSDGPTENDYLYTLDPDSGCALP